VSLVGQLALDRLRCVLSTGSPLPPESFDYLLREIRPGVQISSISGGTDIVSCFALGNPLLPVRRGQLQCRGLGMAVDVFDSDGQPVRNAPGELVCTRPFPSMPVGFWNDPDGSRYRSAYFERFPGVWTHGDWTLLTEEGGLIIEGRSDAVLNPGGVRIGTAEIYRQVERLAQVRESVCIGQRWDNDVRVVLFVVLAEGQTLDDELRDAIRDTLRRHASPRHVPAKILQVSDIPRTRSGKISELAVRDTVEGRAVGNTEALQNPSVLAEFRDRPELEQA
jgi:acetoacetyl-CoA synthetase